MSGLVPLADTKRGKAPPPNAKQGKLQQHSNLETQVTERDPIDQARTVLACHILAYPTYRSSEALKFRGIQSRAGAGGHLVGVLQADEGDPPGLAGDRIAGDLHVARPPLLKRAADYLRVRQRWGADALHKQPWRLERRRRRNLILGRHLIPFRLSQDTWKDVSGSALTPGLRRLLSGLAGCT